jgi:hypothetical protein
VTWWEEVDPPLGALGEWGASTLVLPVLRRIFSRSLRNLAELADARPGAWQADRTGRIRAGPSPDFDTAVAPCCVALVPSRRAVVGTTGTGARAARDRRDRRARASWWCRGRFRASEEAEVERRLERRPTDVATTVAQELGRLADLAADLAISLSLVDGLDAGATQRCSTATTSSGASRR